MFAQKNNGRVLVKVAVALLVVVVAGVFVWRRLESVARVKIVGRGLASDAVTGSVSVAADGGYKEVKSEAGGKVIDAQAINKGEHFKKGDPLVQLDTTDIQRLIDESKRNFEATQKRIEIELKDNPEEKVAEDALETAKRLLRLNNVSEEQVKAAERALNAIRRRLDLAKFDRQKAEDDYKARMEDLELQKKRMTVLAPPVDGEVKEPATWEGALIGQGQVIATVFSNARIVSALISEESFGKIRIGQKARLRLLSQGSMSFDAKVSKLLTTADASQRFEVYLDVLVDDPKKIPHLLKPGSTGEVTITVDEHPDQIVIPRRARFNNDRVFVVKNGRVEMRKVEIGFDSSLNNLEILKGLKEGEQVIVDNLDQFRDGDRVKVEIVN